MDVIQPSTLLIDSGASRSIVDRDFCKKLGATIKPLRRGEVGRLTGINKHPLEICGKCDLSLEIDGRKIQHTFVIIKNASVNCLVGENFWSLFGVKLDFETGKIRIRGLGELSLIKRSEFVGYVRLAREVRLYPKEIISAVVTISGGGV